MIHPRANVGHDIGELIAPVRAYRFHEDPHRLVEFADAAGRLVELQLGAERDLEKTFPDFVVGKISSLGGAAARDIGIFCMR
jgi:hypothetical protein